MTAVNTHLSVSGPKSMSAWGWDESFRHREDIIQKMRHRANDTDNRQLR